MPTGLAARLGRRGSNVRGIFASLLPQPANEYPCTSKLKKYQKSARRCGSLFKAEFTTKAAVNVAAIALIHR